MSELPADSPTFAALFTHSPDVVMVLDAALVVAAINPIGASLLEISADILTGKPLESLCQKHILPARRVPLVQNIIASAQNCLTLNQPCRDRYGVDTAPGGLLYDFTYTPVEVMAGAGGQVLIVGRAATLAATSAPSPNPGLDLGGVDDWAESDGGSGSTLGSIAGHEKLAFLERVIDAIPQGLFWKDTHAIYRWCNRSWANLVGLDHPQDIVGKTDRDLPWDTHKVEGYQDHDLTVMHSGIPQCDRLTVRQWATGEQVWFMSNKFPWRSDQGEVQGLFCTFELITEYRRAAELKESKDLLQLVLNNIPQLLFWKDRKCQYLGCNQNWAQAAGIENPDAVVGKLDDDIWSPEEAQLYREQDEAVMASGVPVMHLIEQQGQADKVAWIDVNKIPIRDAENNVVGILGTIEDITERKQAEMALVESEAKLREQTETLEQMLQELKQTQVQLIQTEKMSGLGQLVAGIAHEINNPVNFIHGNVSHAREYTQNLISLISLYQKHYAQPHGEIVAALEDIDFDFLREDVEKLLNSMSLGTDRIRKIVLSLRNFSRLDESAIKDVDIHEGLESTLTILQGRLKSSNHGADIQIVRQYNAIPRITCYGSQLNQVFMNILVNAIDALNERDCHRSLAECSARPSTITLSTDYLPERDSIQVRIHDNGSGIPAAVRDRIFDPFFTTKAVGKGTGLGLSISYQIVVEKHGGSLTCHSTPDDGTEFCIELPIGYSDPL